MTGRNLLTIAIAAGAVIPDLRQRRIPNWYLLVCGAAAAGFSTAAGSGGIQQTCSVMIPGILVPAALLIPLFLFRMIGAADIKLLMVLGILLGGTGSLHCVFRSMLFGAVFAAGVMAAYENAGERFAYLGSYIRRYLATREKPPYRGAWDEKSQIHMTVPILMAVLTMCG